MFNIYQLIYHCFCFSFLPTDLILHLVLYLSILKNFFLAYFALQIYGWLVSVCITVFVFLWLVTFCRQRFMDWWDFFLSTPYRCFPLSSSLHCFWREVTYHLYCCCSVCNRSPWPDCFQNFSLSLVFNNLTIMCLSVIFFVLLGIFSAS